VGGLARVEKVKPDPLNLSVNTGVGKQFIIRNKFIIENNNFIEIIKKCFPYNRRVLFFA